MQIEVVEGDITDLNVDAIVNAANRTLLGGGGVDGRIHEVAGPELLTHCESLGGCPPGSAKITPGFNLKAKYIIHAVGPVWNGGKSNEEAILKSAYEASLTIASEHKLKSLAIPNISTGIYRFPKEQAALIAIQTTQSHLRTSHLKNVTFVCFDPDNFRIYHQILNSVKNYF